jgi:hypothetical protein
MNMPIFWNVGTRSLVNFSRRFRDVCCLHENYESVTEVRLQAETSTLDLPNMKQYCQSLSIDVRFHYCYRCACFLNNTARIHIG